MILKGIKLEGRIKIYMLTAVMFIASTFVWDLPKLWMSLIAAIILGFIYVYACTYVSKKFAMKSKIKLNKKCKEVK